MVPDVTAKYTLAHRCLPQYCFLRCGNSWNGSRELVPLNHCTEPLHDLADDLVRSIADERVHMVRCCRDGATAPVEPNRIGCEYPGSRQQPRSIRGRQYARCASRHATSRTAGGNSTKFQACEKSGTAANIGPMPAIAEGNKSSLSRSARPSALQN